MWLTGKQWAAIGLGQVSGTFFFMIIQWPPHAHHDLFIAFGGMLVPTALALLGAVIGRIKGVAGAAIGMIVGYVLFFAPASVMMFAN
ncbi:hypothetical protein [Halomonas chromatireducens]|uniref:Uncharacterized protein n=1 Tax=Halomonas chromatireducens TaxID=507626 RepID=A0A120JW46_9GAMM|nr:hypothetical protein [Halomonas chromatireducens]AMD01176.1 hypothetical protein LOKO_02112 [Halomonas chromatireducens]